MNNGQLRKLGVPDDAMPTTLHAVVAIKTAQPELTHGQIKESISNVIKTPRAFLDDAHWRELAAALVNEPPPLPPPKPYRTWGRDIDALSHTQMRTACTLPMAHGGALMPDAHVGYGVPIGGVLALENAVVPYAVGVDIGCRMKLSVVDMPPDTMNKQFDHFRNALNKGTRFGVGATHSSPQDHAVMDEDWKITGVTTRFKDKAWKQLGTSGSGNHFVECGVLTLADDCAELNLQAGQYTALLSHSGSRGTGAAVCDTYSRIAQNLLPSRYKELGRLGWLDLNKAAGQEYWAAMNLMGDYAAANHDVIHRLVAHLLGARIIAGVENHHNFAWKEEHFGRELIVHRKGATPAGPDVLGVIPGSMADPAFIVRGKGQPESYMSASHGAGRAMSRTAARNMFNFRSIQDELREKGVRVLSAGADEVPGAYKNILEVMSEQTDLVDVLGRFDPRIVKMSDDGKAED